MIVGKNIDLRPIEISDAEFVLSLRLDAELNQHLSAVEDNIEKQREWIKSCLLDPKQWYFIIQNKKQEPVGTIRIYGIKDTGFCWGSWIVKPEARLYASFESAILLYQYAFFDLGFDYSYFDVRKNNENVIRFHLRFGATITGESEEDVFMAIKKETFVAKQSEYHAIIDKISRRTK